ncbi:MAG: hypothetical protein IBJ00_05050, partial [Alphaproteobacteria bacterium]|nr:hypothetical protein [Alphaproteobacteria bacterium]
MKILLFKNLAFITIALLFSHTLKASSTEEDREKLLNFSSNGKLKLARLAIRHHCSIDQLIDGFENGEDNLDLQLDVEGFLAILGNIGDGDDSLTIRGQKLKALIDQNVNTDTISLALNNVRGELGGNGDLLTRAEALQGIIDDTREKINGATTSLPDAITQLEGLVIPAPPSNNIYLRTQDIIAELIAVKVERDTALGERDQARTERDTALGERDEART